MARKHSFFETMALFMAVVCLLCTMTAALPHHDIEHNCSGADCLVCQCVSLREQFGQLQFVLVGLVWLSLLIFICAHNCKENIFSGRWTPVCLKVKLSN